MTETSDKRLTARQIEAVGDFARLAEREAAEGLLQIREMLHALDRLPAGEVGSRMRMAQRRLRVACGHIVTALVQISADAEEEAPT